MPRKPSLVPDLRRDPFGGDVETVAMRAFGRAAGAPHSEGNAVRLLLDAKENFPAWLDAIRAAQRSIFFECYILDDDEVAREFATALIERAHDGVAIYVLFDWLGSISTGAYWLRLRESGIRVAAFNPPQLSAPLGWIMRDHRKTIVVDGRVAFVSGLCVSGRWLGDAAKDLEPWRDTGVEIRGPAVADLEEAFAQVWRATGEAPITRRVLTTPDAITVAGNMRVRTIAGQPASASTYRLDLLVAALAHERLWLTDAYFVGTAAYVQALRAASRDGVDVRLLVPGSSDIAAVAMLSRAGYRSLLTAGIRVFEWNGTMLHAKTAVADRHWSRIGSTNLNLASLIGNYELDVAIEDNAFATRMAQQFEADLLRATEIVLTNNRVRRASTPSQGASRARRASTGSATRAAAGAVSVGSALGAALTNRRALAPTDTGALVVMAIVFVALGIVGFLWPRIVAWPAAAIIGWIGLSWLGRAWALKRGESKSERIVDELEDDAAPSHDDDVGRATAERPAADKVVER
ncbi:MAG TPA: phospholipase D-like domain-containing protein [Casimicrobiaceae bacterium]|nr:phospholipase D-like domain-containing protein [Casimicrobiaceae bacterium]